MQRSTVSTKFGRLASPLAKGGLRGVFRSSINLSQPLFAKEGSRTSNDQSGNVTGTLLVLLLCLCPLISSCNLLIPAVFIGEHQKRVSAEFDKLENHRVAILVWTDPSTLFDYPYARFELASYVRDKLFSEMALRQLPIDLVEARDVEEFLQRNAQARIDPRVVGKAFKADYVIYLEVLKFQIRDPDQPLFLRGEIHASVFAHDMHADPDELLRYELAPVKSVFPEGPPILINATNSPQVREATYRIFAEQVARKFYEHNVDL